MNKRKSQSGITLIALVVTIIIIIILASVSIVASIGDNGIMTQAVEKRQLAQDVQTQEKLGELLVGFFVSPYMDQPDGLYKYLKNAKENGRIDAYLSSTDGDTVVLKKDGMYYKWTQSNEDPSTYVADKYELEESLKTIMDEAERTDTRVVVLTQKTLDIDSSFTFENGNSYVVMDSNLESDDFDFHIPAGDPITIKIAYDMNIDNSNSSDRAAISLDPGATLNLYIYQNVQVHSGVGATTPKNTGSGAEGGHGAFAGIRVPETATLNLYGSGKLIAIGGDASNGGSASSNDAGGGGGGGAGAGIGGNGGKGGNSNRTSNKTDKFNCSGTNGEPGENCGTVNIHGTLQVYAIGGAGASGGVYENSKGSGTGGGGYPAAGIGGGGAGGGGADHMNAGGGYSAGVGEFCNQGYHIFNGAQTTEPTILSRKATGGSYYSSGKYMDFSYIAESTVIAGKIGGQGGNYRVYDSGWILDSGGDGGVAGKGGTVKVNNTSSTNKATVYAFNGNMITESGWDYSTTTYEYDKDGNQVGELSPITVEEMTFIPTIIFAQKGILRNVYKLNAWWDVKKYSDNTLNNTVDYFESLFGTIDYPILSIKEEVNENDSISNFQKPESSSIYYNCNSISSSMRNQMKNNGNYLIRPEIIEETGTYNIKTRYINPMTNSMQGIGSGAGYIELSNGTYTECIENENGVFQ